MRSDVSHINLEKKKENIDITTESFFENKNKIKNFFASIFTVHSLD